MFRGRSSNGQNTTEGQRATAEMAAFSRALRVLRAHGTSLTPLDAYLFVEALEFVRFSLEAATVESAKGGPLVKQLLEAGLLTGELLPMCLSTSRCWLQASVIRLLHAAYVADSSAVHGVMLQSGLWPRLIAAAAQKPDALMTHVSSASSSSQALDVAIVMGDVLACVCAALRYDPQMLLWLATSTDLVGGWHAALDGLVMAVADTTTSDQHCVTAVSRHIHALFEAASVAKSQFCKAMPSPPTGNSYGIDQTLAAWAPATALFSAPCVAGVLAEGLHRRMPVTTRRIAASALGTLCGLHSMGVDLGFAAASEEILSRHACDLFMCTAEGSGVVADSQVACVAAQCLVSLLHAAPGAGHAAWRSGFLAALGRHVALLLASGDAPRTFAACGTRLIWALRVMTALFVSSAETCEDAKAGVSTEARGGPVLLATLQSLRSVAEKDDTLCLEVLDMLIQCTQSEEAALQRSACESLPAFLLRHEFVQWMMRLTQRRKLSSVVFCKVMDVLSLCSDVLSGKPALFRYLSELVEMASAFSKAHGRTSQTALFADEWRCRRFVAMLRFIASLHLCARSTALLVSAAPSARAAQTEAGGPQTGGLGMDFWLDLIDPDGRRPPLVRIVALQVLLAIATGSSPHAKAYFIGSNRAPPVLLKLLTNSNAHVALLALNIIWVLVHNHQKGVQLFRRLQATEIINSGISARPQHKLEHATYVDLMAKQLSMILG